MHQRCYTNDQSHQDDKTQQYPTMNLMEKIIEYLTRVNFIARCKEIMVDIIIPRIHHAYEIEGRNQWTMVPLKNAYRIRHYTRNDEQKASQWRKITQQQ